MGFLTAALLTVAISAPLLVKRLGRRAFVCLALAPAAAVGYALTHTGAALDQPITQTQTWVPGLGLALDFRLDALSWLMLLIVGGVGTLVLAYCAAYFKPGAPGMRRFAAVLTAFAGAMVGLVTTDNLLLLFVFWELTTVFSYLLIGHYFDRQAARRAAMQAIVITATGGLTMLVGIIALGVAGGTWRISELELPPGAVGWLAAGCLLVGAATKSALLPFHFWLPAAMAAPTPVSAYLHAAAMVKAGVYLVARFAPLFAEVPLWHVLVVGLGAATLLFGGYRALRQTDLKLLLAFGTVSQLGLLILLLGFGSSAVALAGLALLAAHAMFKAALFLVVGLVDTATGTRDLTELRGLGLRRRMPLVAGVAGAATASMIALPPFAGFVAKEAALEAWLHDGFDPLAKVALVALVLGSALTVAYGLRFWWGAFGGPAAVTEPVLDRRSPLGVGPPLVLAVAGLAAGLLPTLSERLLWPYAATYPRRDPGHLALWAGVTPAFGLTIAAIGAGAALFWFRLRHLAPPARWTARPHLRPADMVYRRVMRHLDDFAAVVTSTTQRGSLPFYLMTIFLVLCVGPGFAALRVLLGVAEGGLEIRLVPWDRPAQLVVVVIMLVAASLAVGARKRTKAVLLVGAAGYGNAVLFALHGAPDLALTQVLAETTTLIVMLLVLRRLPSYFSQRPLRESRWARRTLALVMGLAAMALVTIAPLARTAVPSTSQQATSSDQIPASPLAAELLPAAAIAAGGRNIVNATLVDMRAWDTVGEISVLLMAATGVASLVYLREPSRRAPRLREAGTAAASPPSSAQPRWIAAASSLPLAERSVMFEVVTRAIFHALVVFGVFLLFRGHNAPGGGFTAGLVVGLALTVRYLAGGRFELGEAAPVQPGLVFGAGLFLATAVGLGSLLLGRGALTATRFDLHLPLFGEVHVITSLFFDLGVFLVVLGLILDILRSLGAKIDATPIRRSDPGPSLGPASQPGSLPLTGLPTWAGPT